MCACGGANQPRSARSIDYDGPRYRPGGSIRRQKPALRALLCGLQRRIPASLPAAFPAELRTVPQNRDGIDFPTTPGLRTSTGRKSAAKEPRGPTVSLTTPHRERHRHEVREVTQHQPGQRHRPDRPAATSQPVTRARRAMLAASGCRCHSAPSAHRSQSGGPAQRVAASPLTSTAAIAARIRAASRPRQPNAQSLRVQLERRGTTPQTTLNCPALMR